MGSAIKSVLVISLVLYYVPNSTPTSVEGESSVIQGLLSNKLIGNIDTKSHRVRRQSGQKQSCYVSFTGRNAKLGNVRNAIKNEAYNPSVESAARRTYDDDYDDISLDIQERSGTPRWYNVARGVLSLASSEKLADYCSSPYDVASTIEEDIESQCSLYNFDDCDWKLSSEDDFLECGTDQECIFDRPMERICSKEECTDRMRSVLNTFVDHYCQYLTSSGDYFSENNQIGSNQTLYRKKRQAGTISGTVTYNNYPYWQWASLAAAYAVKVAAGLAILSVLVADPLPAVTHQLIPPGYIPVGKPGAGGHPVGPALKLAPYNTVPVEVYPPFEDDCRKYRAVCVVFAEDMYIANLNHRLLGIKNTYKKKYVRRSKRSNKYMTRHLQRDAGWLKNLDGIRRCMKTRMQFGLRKHKKREKYPYKYPKESYNDDIDSFDDCFKDIGEPRYGYTCRVEVVRDQECILGSTCEGTTSEEGTFDDYLFNHYYPKNTYTDSYHCPPKYESPHYGTPDDGYSITERQMTSSTSARECRNYNA